MTKVTKVWDSRQIPMQVKSTLVTFDHFSHFSHSFAQPISLQNHLINVKNLLLLAGLLILLTGCQRTDISIIGTESPLIFQSEYTNYAWGYSHSGWIMDGTGTPHRFRPSAKWVFPDSEGYLSAADMTNNFNACDSTLTKVSSADFSLYSGKAMTCANGPFSKQQTTMADAGEQIQCFYTYEAAQKRYKRVILRVYGDYSQDNLAANTGDLVIWMKTIK